jgi:beta-lactamase superfamily II metal-dependent hydrolase
LWRSLSLPLDRTDRDPPPRQRGASIFATRSRARGARRTVSALLLVWALWLAGPALATGTLRIDFIDVGQGDAALVTSPTGKTVLIDGGPGRSAPALTRFLDAQTDGPLDMILLSHRHEDHLGGLTAAVHQVGARMFLDAPVPNPGPAYTALMHELAEQKVAVGQATRGRQIALGAGATLTLIGPPDPPITGSRSDVNANSVVARLSFGRFAVLFAGDAEAPTEAWLLASGATLHATVLKVAHHGSRYASRANFLDQVGAQVAIVSVGARNGYHHPAAATLEHLAGRGAHVYRTDVDGTVTLETDGAVVRIRATGGRRETLELP